MEKILASMIVLHHNLRVAHWEITGPNFIGLHDLLGRQYLEFSDFVDRVAEFIRIRGKHTMNMSRALEESVIQDISILERRSWESWVASISNSLVSMANMVQESEHSNRSWNKLADDVHEWLLKQSWLLKSHLLSS